MTWQTHKGSSGPDYVFTLPSAVWDRTKLLEGGVALEDLNAYLRPAVYEDNLAGPQLSEIMSLAPSFAGESKDESSSSPTSINAAETETVSQAASSPSPLSQVPNDEVTATSDEDALMMDYVAEAESQHSVRPDNPAPVHLQDDIVCRIEIFSKPQFCLGSLQN